MNMYSTFLSKNAPPSPSSLSLNTNHSYLRFDITIQPASYEGIDTR